MESGALWEIMAFRETHVNGSEQLSARLRVSESIVRHPIKV